MQRWIATVLLVAGLGLVGTGYVWAEEDAAEGAKPAVASPQTRPATGAAAELGQAAPGFTLRDQSGKSVSLSDYAGKIVVLEWINPECPYVQRHYKQETMQSLASKYRDKGVVWLAINTTFNTTAESDKTWVTKYDLAYPILSDRDAKVARQYGAKTTPHMYVIDRGGKLVYKGAIDDNPRGDKEQATNYVDDVLAKLTSGQEVTPRETKPYGCSVKFPSK